MAEGPLVSIIIVNYNGRKYLQQCFEPLLAGTYENIEIIFVDNCSSDGSVNFVRGNFPQMLVIENQENLGLAKASNKGARAAKGKYLFFYNNDTIADKFLVERLVKKMEADYTVGICGCRTYTYDGKNLANEGVACDIFGYPYGKGKTFYVDAAIFIRRELFERMFGFDERMFLYGEDRDICWRCWLYGFRVIVVPEAVFFHDSSCILREIKHYRTNIRRRFLGESNSLMTILKNYSSGFLLFILPCFILINIAEVFIFFFLKGNLEVCKDVYLRSYIVNLKSLVDTLRKRKVIQRERKISDFGLIKHMSLTSNKLRLFLKVGIPEIAWRPGKYEI